MYFRVELSFPPSSPCFLFFLPQIRALSPSFNPPPPRMLEDSLRGRESVLLCVSWGLNTGGQAQWEVPFAAETPLWPLTPLLMQHMEMFLTETQSRGGRRFLFDMWRSSKVTHWENSNVKTRSQRFNTLFSALTHHSSLLSGGERTRWFDKWLLLPVKSASLSLL